MIFVLEAIQLSCIISAALLVRAAARPLWQWVFCGETVTREVRLRDTALAAFSFSMVLFMLYWPRIFRCADALDPYALPFIYSVAGAFFLALTFWFKFQISAFDGCKAKHPRFILVFAVIAVSVTSTAIEHEHRGLVNFAETMGNEQ